MAKTQTVESGKYDPNTIEIYTSFCYPELFIKDNCEQIVKDAGFSIMNLKIMGENSTTSKSEQYNKLYGNVNYTNSITTRERIHIPTLRSDFSKCMEKALQLNCGLNCINSITLKNNFGDIYSFRMKCSGIRRMLLYRKNGVSAALLDVDQLMKECSGLFKNQCFWKPPVLTPGLICDVPKEPIISQQP